ncbi:MAG: ATP-binding protein [Dehalococcoidia bacterium]|nr:ATP-binding protein [Dehalococcoidia bacterium]
MSTKNRIVTGTILIALGFWVVDAIIDVTFFSHDSFLDTLILGASAYELYIRSLGMAFILIPGIIVSRVYAHSKRVGEEMRESEGRLLARESQAAKEWQETFDAMSEGVAILSPERCILRANLSLARMLGSASVNELIGKHCHELVHGLNSPPLSCLTCASLLTKLPSEAVFEERHLGGRWLSLRGDPILDANGEVVQLVHTFVDVTEEKRRQKALERLHNMSQILSSTLDLQQALHLAVGEIGSIFGGLDSTVGIALLGDGGQWLTIAEALGPRKGDWEGISLPLDQLLPEAIHALFNERRPWVQSDLARSSQAAKGLPGFWKHGSFVALPLVSGDTVIGVIFLARIQTGPVSGDEMALLETCAGEIALAVHNAQLFTRTDVALRRRVVEQEALMGVLESVSASLDIEKTLQDGLNRAATALGVDRASVLTVDESEERATMLAVYHAGAETPPGKGMVLEVGAHPWLQAVLQHKRATVVEDASRLPDGNERNLLLRLGVRSALRLPIVARGKAIGTLQFGTVARTRAFSEEEMLLGQAFANHLASAIENARLHERTVRERATLESIINGMTEGLAVIGNDRRVAYFNRAAESLVGANAADLVGHDIGVLQSLLGRRATDPEALRVRWADARDRLDETPKFEIELMTGVGKRVVEATIFRVGDKASLSGTGALIRDVTREREVDRMKSEFVATVSHELRTPMTAIYGFSELLLMRATGLPENQRMWVETIYKESKRLTDIVEDLLNVSRIEAGRLSLNLGPVALEQLVADVVERLKSGHAHHPLNVNIAVTLPEVQADRDKLQQVLYNLVDNAIKYSPRGGPVAISAQHMRDEGKVVVSVADKGIGISDSEIPRLFSRFHRVERLETTGIRGTGLGLYIVKSLVEMMGGRIWVESRLNEGTTFFFSLPVAASSSDVS